MRLSVENFGLWKNKTEILFPTKPGLYLVHGKNNDDPDKLEGNSVGKTQLFGALSWCLYGTTPEGQKGSGIANDKKKPVSVVMDWNGRRIERRTSPGRLLIDGKDTTQEELNHLVRLSSNEWKSTVHITQDIYVFVDWSSQDQSSQIANVLQLDRWSNYGLSALEMSKQFDKEIKEIESKLKHNSFILSSNKNHILRYKEEIELLNEDRIQFQKEYDDLSQKIQKDSSSLEKELDDLLVEKQKLYKGIDPLEEEGLKKEITSKQREKDRLAFSIESLEKEKQILSENICKTCGQALPEEGIANRLIHTDEKIDDLKTQYQKCVKEINVKEKELLKIQKKVEKLRAQGTDLEERIVDLRIKVEVQRKETQNNKDNLEVINRSLQSNKKSVERKNTEIDLLISTNQELEKENNHLTKETEEIEHVKILCDMWGGEFKNIRTLLLEEVLETLTALTNEYLSYLMSGWAVQFLSNKELSNGETRTKVTMSVQSPDGFASDMSNWSGGVKDRLRLATSMAFSDYLLSKKGLDVPFEIYDEPTKFMSPKGVDSFLSLLKHRSRTKNIPIFLIVHNNFESSEFDGEIIITKKNGIVSDHQVIQYQG